MAICAFLGLGVMGYPMAGHLVAAGHDVRVWNRTGSKAIAWAGDYNGQAYGTIEAAVEGADFVKICVGDDPDPNVHVNAILWRGRKISALLMLPSQAEKLVP